MMLPVLFAEQICRRCGKPVPWEVAVVLVSDDQKFAGVRHPECVEESNGH